MKKWKHIAGWAAAGFLAFVVIIIVGGYFVLQSSPFEHWALAKVIQKTEEATGAQVTAESLEINPRHLTATLHNLTLRGKEADGPKPLLSVESLTVGVSGSALLHGHLGLSELLVERPIVHVYVDAMGHSNLPTPASPKQGKSSFSLFKTTIGHAVLSNGEIYYNNSKSSLGADVYNLNAQSDFNSFLNRYRGHLGYDHGEIRYAKYPPLNSGLQIQFTATPAKFSLSPLQIKFASSQFLLSADLTNYADPRIDGSYQVLLHTQDFAPTLAANASVNGDIRVAGSIHYHNNPNRPAVNAVALTGNIDGPSLYFANGKASLHAQALRGTFQLQNGDLQVNGAAVNLLNGEIDANLLIKNLSGTPRAQFAATFHGLSLQAAKESVQSRQAKQVPVAGTLGGSVEGSWLGSVKNIVLRADAALRGEIRSTQQTNLAPLTASLHATYNGPQGTLTLRDTKIATPGTFLTANGTVSRRSQLAVQAGTDNLRNLALLASAFSKSAGAEVPAISGSARLNATVRGTMKAPEVTAHVAVLNLQARGTEWRTAQLTVQANPSQISIQNGSIVNRKQGQASFSGGAGLHHWAFTPSSPLHLNASIQNFSLAQLEDLTGKSFPVKGNLNATVTLRGSELEPEGNGSLQLTHASIENEQLRQFVLQFHAAQGVVHATLNTEIPAGTATIQASFAPKTKAYEVHASAPAIVLNQLTVVQQKNLPLTGTLTLAADGKGTLENPQLTANIQVPQLQFQKTKAGEVQIQLEVASHKANLAIRSDVSQASIHAKADVSLAGNYQTTATLDTSAIPLAPLLSTYVASLPPEFQGTTEIHAAVNGPLKHPAEMKADLTIPTFKASYRSLQLSNAAPIRVNYANEVATIQPAEFRGTDTDLHFGGTIPIRNMKAMAISTKGNLNLKLLEMFDPSVISAGNVTLDLRTTGGKGLGGEVQLKDAALSTQEAPIAVEKLNATFAVKPDRVQISNFNGQVGGGTLTASGSVTYKPQLQFNLALQAKSVRIRYPEGLRTVLDSSLNFTGTTAAASLNGQVLIDSISFTPDFDLAGFAGQLSGNSPPTVSEGFSNRIKLAISIQTAGQFRAASSQISLEGNANLRVIGTISDPVIVGRTDLTSGEVFFMKKRYELQRGIINFVNPNRTEPVVNILIAVTVEQYNLNITLTGPVERLRINYVSDPPLPPVDIINLIARGQTTEESTPGNFGANSILASGIASELSSSIGKLAGFSSIQIDPLLGDNGRNPSARIAVQQRVSKNLLFTFSTDVTQPQSEIIQGEYQINRRWSVSASRDESGGVAVDARYHTTF